jgi:hypothetical protein
MAKKVYIIEIAAREEYIDGTSTSEAIKAAEDMYDREEIVLDYDDHVDTKFVTEEQYKEILTYIQSI